MSSREPITLKHLAEIAELDSWQQARDLIARAAGLFVMDHSYKFQYLSILGLDFFKLLCENKLYDAVLGSDEDRKDYSCAFSTVKLAHKIVFEWYFIIEQIELPSIRVQALVRSSRIKLERQK